MTEPTTKFVSLETQLRQEALDSSKKGQCAALVLRFGRKFEFQPRLKKYGSGQPQICYVNSYRCAKRHKIIYVEGYASSPFTGEPFLHAWCVEPGSNLVIDRTCRGIEYIGIPFQFSYVHSQWKAGSIGLIYDEKADWPLLKMTPEEIEAVILKD